MSKHFLITGASSGIGNHFAKEMLNENHNISAASSNFDKLKQSFSGYTGDNLQLLQLDVTKIENWQQALAKTTARFGSLDYLFNIAGVATPGFVQQIDIGDIDYHMDINAKGAMYGSKLGADLMIKQGGGHIVNIASLAALVPVSGLACYSASKYALRAFTLAMAADVKPFGVYMSVVCPDLVKTPLMEKQLEFEQESALVFTGKQALEKAQISQVLKQVIRDKSLETNIPFWRGVFCKMGDFAPSANMAVSAKMRAKGSANIRRQRNKK